MIGLEVKEARVFVRPGCTDMRKQINGLAVMAEQVMEAILKALYWDRNGFCLWQKKLQKDHFPWPRTSEQARVEIDAGKLRMLLEGIDFWSAHQPLSYQRVS